MMGENIERQIAMYGNMQMIAGIGALVFLAAAAALFFWLRIPQVVGELTGKRAKKEMRRMASDTMGSGRNHGASGHLKKTKRNREKFRDSGRLNRRAAAESFHDSTEKLCAPETAVMNHMPETVVMNAAEDEAGTSVLKHPAFPVSDFIVEKTILLIHTGERDPGRF